MRKILSWLHRDGLTWEALPLYMFVVWVPIGTLSFLPACQRQEAIATTGDHEEPSTEDQLSGPYEDSLSNEVHALNTKVDKLLELLKCVCAEEGK